MRRSLLPRLAVAVLPAVIAVAVYRSCVFAQFEPIRLDVVGQTLHASRRSITITLPELSAFRGQTVVFGVRLQNTLLTERQIRLVRQGFPQKTLALPPHRTIRWDIVVAPATVNALDTEVGEGARTLEFTGDADGWALTALELRNYHHRVADRWMVIVPSVADGHVTGPAFLPVAIALCFLIFVNVRAPTARQRSLRLMGNWLAVAAVLACLTCLLLPRLFAYKILLSPSAFLFLAGALFSPALVSGASSLAATVPALFRRSAAIAVKRSSPLAIVGDYWRRHETTFERGTALLGLVAIAIAQPIFEVVSNSPEFFAARGTTAATAVAVVLTMCFGIPFALLAIERALRMVNRRTASAFHAVVLALLSAAIVMPWLRRSEVLPSPQDAWIGVLIGGVAALGAARIHFVRQFLTTLAFAAVVVPALFLFDSSVRRSVLPSPLLAAVPAIERTPPIVFVLFDELPLNSLLDTDGNVDAERYPNIAALARESYWYRNASTVASNTIHAVPAILSGRYPTTVNELPTTQYYPVNLFTTLVGHYDISAFFRFQSLCPPRACRDDSAIAADTVKLLLADLGLVWLHIVLPQPLTDRLPPVTDDWAEFAGAREAPVEAIETGRGGLFAQFVASIDGRPARLHFIHSMLPHMALEYVPSGRRYRLPDYETVRLRQSRLFERASAAYADMLHQRHLAQVAFVDHLVGNLVARLRAVGVYDKALVIITSDHGASYREGRSRREPEQRNLSDILLVPVLMKLPGQQHGEVVDQIVETVDILPTILDVVGAKTSLRFDGRSLVDPRAPPRVSRTFIWRNRLNAEARTIGDLSPLREESLERKERRFGRGDLTALYAPPAVRHLLGVRMTRLTMPAARDVQITIRNRRQFEAVNLARDPLPLYVTGVLNTSRLEPLTVAVVVNGITSAVTHSFRERNVHVFGTLIPESSLREGKNNVTAFVLDAGSAP